MPKSKFDFTTELAALESDEFTLNLPLTTFVGEAHDIARFFRDHYKADKASALPGLVDAGKRVSSSLGDEIDALVTEVRDAQLKYEFTVDPKADRGKLDRAIELVDEISAVLKFHFNDGVEDEDDVRIANVIKAHGDAPETPDALSGALDAWAGLADLHKAELDGIGGFDPALIREAKKLATELLDVPEATRPTTEAKAALAKRNRLLQLMDARVRTVRDIARFIFRKHPEIARKASSAYERVRRANAKRMATRKKNTAANGEGKEPAAPNA